MPGIWDWLSGAPGGGVLAPQGAQGDVPAQSAPSRLGLFGATLQDVGANLSGDRAGATHLAGYDEDVRKSQIQTLMRDGFGASDPAVRARAYQTARALGIDPSPFQKQAASAGMPDLLNAIGGGAPVISTAPVSMPAGMQQLPGALPANDPSREAAQRAYAGPGGLSLAEALPRIGNPELSAEMAPEAIKMQLAASAKEAEPYTLVPGQQRFQGGKMIASVPERNNPNQPFNVDGTPNKAYQDYETAKRKADQAPQWANVDLARQRLSNASAGVIDPDTLTFMAQQVLAGDKSPFANIGRGVQGAGNLAALRKEVMTQAQHRGLGGADVASLNAEFAGLQAGERTLGTRTANIEMAANEARNLIPLALDASAKVPRTQYPSLNRVFQAIDQGTGGEDIVRLGVAVNGLVNTYARAISPSGTPTVSDKDHARELLDKAWANGQFNAAVAQMDKEISAAQKSPGQVRGAFRSAISGSEHGAASVPDAPSGPIAPQDLPRKAPPSAGRIIEYDASGKRK